MAIRHSKRSTGIDTSKAEASVTAALNRLTDRCAQRLKDAAKKSAVVIRRNCILDWYRANRLSSGSSTASAVKGDAVFKRSTHRITLIEVTTYMMAEKLNQLSDPSPSAARWVNKQSNINSPWSPGLYVYTLHWKTGALALPEKADFTGSSWTNSDLTYSKIGPLRNYTLHRLQAEMAPTIMNIMRSNTNMGAGMTSPGRDTGLANLSKYRRK